MLKLIHTALDKIASFLFPAKCLGCRLGGEFLCMACRKKVRAPCAGVPPGLEKLLSYGNYENGILREALRRFKYHGTYDITPTFAEMLEELIRPHLGEAEGAVVIPIPISKERLRERGYNQAELLAQSLAEKISRPLENKVLLKIKNTPSQTSLSGRERILNVRDSFAVRNPEKISGREIILIDDISTTGATLSEAARVLKQAGAKKVIGLVVARG